MSRAQATGEVRIVATGIQKAAMSIKKGFSDIARDVGQKMKAAAVAGMAGAVAGLAATLKNGFDLKMMDEQTEALMQSMMGGAQKAREAMQMLAAEVRKNPMFSASDINKAGTALAAFSGKSALNLQKLINASQMLSTMKLGASLDDAAQALRDALGGETERLKEFGFTGKELSTLKEGGITLEKFMAALQGKGVGQHTLEALGNTTHGQILKIKAEWDSISKTIVEGFWPRIQQTAAEFMTWLGENKEQIISFLTSATELAMNLFKWGSTFVDYVMRGIQAIGAFVGAWWENMKSDFSMERLGQWLANVSMAILQAARALVYKLIELMTQRIKEMFPKLFSVAERSGAFDDYMNSVKSLKNDSLAAAGGYMNKAGGLAGVTAGMDAAAEEWERQEAERRNKQPAQATLQVNLQGHNLPAMMGAS